jgi:hypothetical protein
MALEVVLSVAQAWHHVQISIIAVVSTLIRLLCSKFVLKVILNVAMGQDCIVDSNQLRCANVSSTTSMTSSSSPSPSLLTTLANNQPLPSATSTSNNTSQLNLLYGCVPCGQSACTFTSDVEAFNLPFQIFISRSPIFREEHPLLLRITSLWGLL